MSSLKMTFSLASLVLILGLVFVTTPVMAQSFPIPGATAIPAKGYLIIRNDTATVLGATTDDRIELVRVWICRI